ncbi:hypothetical protein [Kocuria aegyptia]|uniref:Uncharacterized protein n=1 Tax=Kocuria aegyptia TaxID=330943 RepID=A0ABP4W9L9_9MICC
MVVSAEKIDAAAQALDLDPNVLMVLAKPSEVRQIPVRLGLLGNEPIYVDSQEQARKLERSDRAYAYITAAAS